MQHTDFLYNAVLMPLVCFGGGSVMLAFVLLLPGVGNLLAGLWSILMTDAMIQKRGGGNSLPVDGQ